MNEECKKKGWVQSDQDPIIIEEGALYMTSDDFSKLVDKFNEQGKMNFLEGATADQIAHFEKDKRITLPSKYKEWLLFCDGGEFFLPAGVQMYGVAHKPLIDIKDNDKPDDNYIVIGALASGEPILCKKNDEKFFIYDHENREIDDDLVYNNFFALLNDLYDLLGIGE